MFHCTRVKERGLNTYISLLSVAGKIYVGLLVGRVRRVTRDLIDDDQGGYRAGRGCVDQIFTLKHTGEKAREKKRRVYVGFIDLEKAYDRVNMKVLWQVYRVYDVGEFRACILIVQLVPKEKGVKVSGLG